MANMFDENGNYNKTEWKPGDRITAGKLNKIEESLEAINNNDIERHKEADERLDALEEQKEAVEERFDELEDLVADNKTEVDTAIYEVHSKMDRLEQEMNDGIDTVEALAHTVDDKIAEADASMKAQVNQGKADMEAMVAEVEGDLEGLHAKDEELSEQLAQRTNKVVVCSEIGLSMDNAGIENFNILTNYLDKGFSIIVDGLYEIQASETYKFIYDIDFKGINLDSGFMLKGDTDFFTTEKHYLNIKLDSLRISTYNNNVCLFSFYDSSVKLNNINIYNCEISKNVSMIYYVGLQNESDPKHGISKVTFTNNKVYETTRNFILINDCPYDLLEFNNNTINNFKKVLFSVGINSTNSEVYRDKCKTMIVRNNKAYNDDSCIQEVTGSVYHCIALCEGDTLIYEHNDIYGLKSDGATTVYDVYSNALNTFVRNNVFKNCICLGERERYTDTILMKSKMDGYKYYENNIYEIEESYITKFDVDVNIVSCGLYHNTGVGKWYIRNNKIDVPNLYFNNFRNAISEYEFTGNTIICNSIVDTCNTLVYLNSIDASKNIKICDNYIKSNKGSLALIQSDALACENVSIQNNYFEFGESNCYSLLGTSSLIKKLEFLNNVININSSTSSTGDYGLFFNSKIDKLNVLNNKIKSSLPINLFSNHFSEVFSLCMDFETSEICIEGYQNCIYLKNIEDLSCSKLKYLVSYELFNYDNSYTCQFEFTLKQENSTKYIEFIRSETGELININLDNPTEDFIKLKTTGQNISMIPIVPRLKLTGGKVERIYISKASSIDNLRNVIGNVNIKVLKCD